MSFRTGLGTTVYLPGQYYNSRGLTPRIWTGEGVQKAVPVEQGFLTHPQAVADSVIVFNGTTHTATAALAKRQPKNAQIGDQLFNEKLIAKINVESGCSSHFVVGSGCYRVSVGEFVIGSDNKRYNLSEIGESYTSLINKSVTIKSAGSGEVKYKIADIEQDGFTAITNATNRCLRIEITKGETSYAPPAAQVAEERRSRQPDLGAKVYSYCILEPGCTKFIRIPTDEFVVYWLSPKSEIEVDGECNLHWCESLPTTQDYIQLCDAIAESGQVAVLLHSNDYKGYECCVADYSEIKPVNSDLAQTKQNLL